MSAVVAIRTPAAVYMFTDGAYFGEDGIVGFIGPKFAAVPGIPAAIMLRGEWKLPKSFLQMPPEDVTKSLFKPILAAIGQPSTFDELFASLQMGRVVEAMGIDQGELVVCGFSETAGPQTLFMPFGKTGNGIKPGLLYQFAEPIAALGPKLPGQQKLRTPVAATELRPIPQNTVNDGDAQQGLSMMESFRKTRATWMGGRVGYGVGGHVDLTCCTRTWMKSKRVRVWSDNVGESVAPEPLITLEASQTNPEQNGLYVVNASGPASRVTAFNTYDSMPGCYFSVMEGTYADTLWRCISAQGGTLGVTALDFRQFTAGREVLSAPRDYYVRADGSDSNTGLADTAGGAFLTLQKAWSAIREIDTNGKLVTVYVGPGTYTDAFTPQGHVIGQTSSGSIVFEGDTTTPSNVHISVTDTDAVYAAFSALTLKGFEIAAGGTTGHRRGVVADLAVVDLYNIKWGTCNLAHMQAVGSGARISPATHYTISGAASAHMLSELNAEIICQNRTITFSGSHNFSDAFVMANQGALIDVTGSSAAGTAPTGKTYEIQSNAVLVLAGVTLPGNAPGTCESGGQVIDGSGLAEIEYIESVVASGSAVSLTTNTATNVTSITLTPGKWNVTGTISFAPAATTSITRLSGGLSTTTASIPTPAIGNRVQLVTPAHVTGTVNTTLPIGTTRINVTTAETVYLVTYCTFTVDTLAAYGGLSAMKVAS